MFLAELRVTETIKNTRNEVTRKVNVLSIAAPFIVTPMRMVKTTAQFNSTKPEHTTKTIHHHH